MSEKNLPRDPSKRAFVKKVAYVTPTILTLPAVSAYAAQGSGGPQPDRYPVDKTPGTWH